MDQKNEIVILTGFGVFRDYKVNPSWEAVRLVNDKKFNEIELFKIQIPVAYEETERAVDEIWNNYKPILVIHCGVHCMTKEIRLEKRAVLNVERYCLPDVNSCLPKTCSKSSDCQKDLKYLCCDLDLDQIRDAINDKYDDDQVKLSATVSERAGEFLCEYIYRCSLQNNSRRTLFVHVPEISEEITAQDIAECLEIILQSALKQIKQK